MNDLSRSKSIFEMFTFWGGVIGGVTGLIYHFFYPLGLCTLCGLSVNIGIGVLLGRLNASGFLRVVDHFSEADPQQFERSIRVTAATITFPASLCLYFVTLLPFSLGLSHPFLTILFWAMLLAAAASGIAAWGCHRMMVWVYCL